MRQDFSNRYPHRPVLKVPFGLKNGRMWGPKQVALGKACGCVCPACRAPLVAKAADSSRKRPHFAHLADTDCRAGYETALHLKAKQLIADRLALRFPAWDGDAEMPNPPFAFDDAGSRLVGRRVDFPSHLATLLRADVEASRGDHIPDVVGVDDQGEVLIEIRVTHAVDELKRRRIQSEGGRLVEIDLSRLDPEHASDEELLAHWVLEEASNRVWLSCPPATEDWRESNRALKLELAARNQQIAQDRQRREEARRAEERARALSDMALVERKENRARFREEQRARFRQHLEDLPALVSVDRIQTLLLEYEERDSANTKGLLADVSEPAKRAIGIVGRNAWIYEVHPALWQAASYRHFIHDHAPGSRFNQRDVARWVMQQFGKEKALYELFMAQYAARDKARKAGFSKYRISHWAFSDLENRQIPNFYAPINEFVERLVRAGCLAYVPEFLGEVCTR